MSHLSVALAVTGEKFSAACTQARPHLAELIFQGRGSAVSLCSPLICVIQTELGPSLFHNRPSWAHTYLFPPPSVFLQELAVLLLKACEIIFSY